MRAALYLRVSTVRQAEKDLSIPDQRRAVTEYCKRKGWSVTSEYVDPGRSARDDNRPSFQQLIADALRPDKPFDVIVVHSLSRFFRNLGQQETYIQKLAEHGILVKSCSEEIVDGIAGDLLRQIIGSISQFENQQRAARVIQTMQENARQGFWNGGHMPYGYRTVTTEMRGEKAKKRLEIDPGEAEVVREIYRLSLRGCGNGPMGVKAIVEHLNAKGLRYRKGRLFRTNGVHRVLRSSTCMGLHYYNRKSGKTNKAKDRSEWIPMEVPAIVEPDVYKAVQQHLTQRRPTVTPARLSNGAMLLTKIARCPHCGGGMSLRTGKSGRYRYYACSHAATKGKRACKGRSIRMEALDKIVLTALEQRLLTPDRLKSILADIAKRVIDQQGQSQEREKVLHKEQRHVETGINRLLDAVEGGLVGDDDMFRRRLSERQQRRDELIRLVAHSQHRRELPRGLLSRRNLGAFGRALRGRLRDPQSGLSKAYVRLLVDRVVVGEREVEIRGSKAALLAAALNADSIIAGEVPTSVQDWRREGPPNKCPSMIF